MGEPIDTDKDGNQLTLLDIMDDGSDIQEQVAAQMQTQQLYQFLQHDLSPREVEILVYRVWALWEDSYDTAGGCEKDGHLPFICLTAGEACNCHFAKAV